MKKKVAIIMGSKSDLAVMQEAADFLDKISVEFQLQVVSAHRTPELMFDFARNAKRNGFSVIIAGAGGAAHLPGMVASLTTLPVIGVPIKSRNSLDGWDSLQHIRLLVTVEKEFNIKITSQEVVGLQNVGQILELIEFKLAKPGNG